MTDQVPAVVEQPRTPAKVDELEPNATMVQMIGAALVDDRVNVDKFERLAALEERFAAREVKKLYAAAMKRLQAKIPVIPKRRKILVKGVLRSKYAAREDIDAVLRPLLEAEGFSIKYDTAIESETKIKIIITIRHEAGHEEKSEITLPLDKSEYRNAVQNYGATITYCQRYALSLALNIVTKDEDDDANSLSVLTEHERDSIEDILAEIGGNSRDQLLAFAGYKAVSEISRGAYVAAMSWCTAKRRQMGQKKQS